MSSSEQKILVLGDSILDHKIFCQAVGLSLETPTLKTRLDHEEYSFGGAANVVNNLLALGADVTFVTPLAQDSFTPYYMNWDHPLLTTAPLYFEGANVVKSRYWVERAGESYKYLQINRGTKFTDPLLALKSIKNLSQKESYDKAILIDYCGGIFEDKKTVGEILSYLNNSGTKTYAASQVSDRENQYDMFYGCDLICLNLLEAKSILADFEPTPDGLQRLSDILDARVCVTLGKNGSILYDGSQAFRDAGYVVDPVDACGAGDSFLAALVASSEDLAFSNKWAAASTLQIGTNAPSLEMVSAW